MKRWNLFPLPLNLGYMTSLNQWDAAEVALFHFWARQLPLSLLKISNYPAGRRPLWIFQPHLSLPRQR